MIKCPVCQAEHPENTLYCEKCGSYLQRGYQKGTDPLPPDELTWMGREETTEAPGERVPFSPLSLKLTILGSGRDVEVPLTREVRIGRLDLAIGCVPEVDLASEGGLTKGVSRRHAKITRRGGQVFIQDLGSINGTLLNRERLVPYLPQVLKSGDELQLGKLVLRVSFKWGRQRPV